MIRISNHIVLTELDLRTIQLFAFSCSLYRMTERTLPSTPINTLWFILLFPVWSILASIGFLSSALAFSLLVSFNRRWKQFDSFQLEITHEAYAHYRISEMVLTQLLEQLQVAHRTEHGFQKTMPALQQAKIAYAQLFILKTNLDSSIARLDHRTHTSSMFMHIDQEMLWKNRCKAYSYLL